MSCRRLIARLDIKGQNVIKGVQMEGLRIVGEPKQFASQYYQDGADELLFIDTVASLYSRENILRVVEETASTIFIPLTVAGGVRTLENAKQLLLSGADKVALNTAAILEPRLLTEIATVFGSQCVVLSVEAQKFGSDWELLTNNGRERTGKSLGPWLETAQKNGVGEVLITSVEKDGTKSGLDTLLMKFAREHTDLPLIGSGGFTSDQDLETGFGLCQLDGIAIASALHYKNRTLSSFKENLRLCGFEIRS